MNLGRPFRFIHSGDFRLELPLHGLTGAPDWLRDDLVEAPYRAAAGVFQAAIAHQVEFVVLSGNLLDVEEAGPRGLAFLCEQFRLLEKHQIGVYWAGGIVDPPEGWPTAVRTPANVHVFPTGQVGEFTVSRHGLPLTKVVGLSRERGKTIRASEFQPDASDLYTIAVLHGSGEPTALRGRGLNYWALGGNAASETLYCDDGGRYIARFCGTPQGRHPGESGTHGCTLVSVAADGRAQLEPLTCDVVRWLRESLTFDEQTEAAALERALFDRFALRCREHPDATLLLTWSLSGQGPLRRRLSHGGLEQELLGMLRREQAPKAWSAALEIETDDLRPQWLEEDSFRGDFLRAVRESAQEDRPALELDGLLEPTTDEGLRELVRLSGAKARRHILARVAQAGADLLSIKE
jgi:DNA repair exonuclease SbcCD nuclease subunit